MSHKITRREVLVAATSALLLPTACASVEERIIGEKQPAKYAHGVASGDPDQNSVVIWTRISDAQKAVSVEWLVAEDAKFKNVINHGHQATSETRDYTVKVVVDSLKPGTNYYYKFLVAGVSSPVGQTHTLPTGHVESLVLAVASCSNYPFGYFNAYDAIARDPDIDLVVHLGDYIYEYSETGYGADTGKRIGRVHEPRHEITSLADYRLRHAQYKTDEGSQAMHARHPLVVIWDDHESANNPWMDGAENHQADEGSWERRKAVSLQAYFEWLPIRDPAKNQTREEYWRHYKFGDLASLITLESRHTGRSKQIDYADHQSQVKTPKQAKEFYQSVVAAPERTLLSNEMEQFLEHELAESVNAGRRWRIIGNQCVMAKSISPKLEGSLFDSLRLTLDERGKNMLAGLTGVGALELPGGMDGWNGYPVARERFYQIARNAGARDLLVLSGDSHSCWANSLFDADDQAMGLELGATGISSPSPWLAFGEEGIKRYDALVAETNKEIAWADGRHRGFIRLHVDHDGAKADFIAVSNVESRNYTLDTIHSVDIQFADDTIEYV